MEWLKITSFVVLLAAGSMFMSASCNNAKNNQGENDSLSVNADYTADSMDQQIIQFKSKWNKKMDQLNVEIDRWEDKVDAYSGEKKEQAQVKLDSLKAQKERLGDRIDQASNHMGAQWDAFKQNVSDSYDSLSLKIKNAFSDDQ